MRKTWQKKLVNKQGIDITPPCKSISIEGYKKIQSIGWTIDSPSFHDGKKLSQNPSSGKH